MLLVDRQVALLVVCKWVEQPEQWAELEVEWAECMRVTPVFGVSLAAVVVLARPMESQSAHQSGHTLTSGMAVL